MKETMLLKKKEEMNEAKKKKVMDEVLLYSIRLSLAPF